MADVLRSLGGARSTPQSDPARADQVSNSAGGYVFALDDMARLRRFLILGVDSPTYYATARELALDNVEVVTRLLSREDTGLAAIRETVEISQAGRAKKNEPALYLLAVAAASPIVALKREALEQLANVARTGTHLFTFVAYVTSHRGWGRSLRRGVGDWYTYKHPGDLALQTVKYRQRDGWDHARLLRLSHGNFWSDVAVSESIGAIFDFVLGRADHERIKTLPTLAVLDGFLQVQERGEELTARDAVRLVTDYRLPWEALPSHVMDSREVWAALLPHMGLTALIRNLPKMTRVGLLEQRGEATREVRRRLLDPAGLKAGRIHPLSLLVAQMTYASGASVRGKATWTPVQPVVDALDEAFYLSFGAVQPTGKSVYLALDVSGSMNWSTVCDTPGLTPRVASAALALVTANVESDYEIRGFSHQMVDVPISPRMRLDQALAVVDGVPMGGTDCAQPMLDAIQRQAKVDLFVTYTDSETWAGATHPFQALRHYRDRFSRPARSVVVGMTASGFSIADPSDPGMLDCVGFDLATPELISSFARGEI